MSIAQDKDIVEANLAIVLTDIIGSTKFVQKNGSHVAAKWFGIHDRYVMKFISENNGRLVDASDGHLMYFATVSDAISFAFQYKKFMRQKKMPFRSRVGIHWDKMLIVKSPEHVVRAGGKRINLEGIGKNIAARTMSLCAEEQILMSKAAYLQFKQFGHRNPNIPPKAQSALVGLYKFKGVAEPETLYAIGLIQAQLQPPPDSEKAKRIGGRKKIKTRLRNKSIMEKFWWVFYRLGFIAFVGWLYLLWPLLISGSAKRMWGIDYWWLEPFEWIDSLYQYVKQNTLWFIEEIKKGPPK